MPAAPFAYQPVCSAEGCGQPATRKIAAVWTDGRFRELKTYGVACPDHGWMLLESARHKPSATRLAEGETIEPPYLYQLAPGRRDTELERVG